MPEWTVPGYTELRALGSGGFGDVVLARHDESGALVAVKYLRHDLLADPGFAAMFRAEATVLASLDDPNVVRLFEYVESLAGAAIVMELVNGVSVREILSRQGATTAEAALVVLQGSLLGLAAAHARGVVHRDYKPENVLVGADGVSKLTDFGIAARAGDRPAPAGTLAYAPPEQFGGAPASPAGDVYAATATFYECLTGHPPFTGDTVEALMSQHRSQPVPLDPVPGPLRPLVAAGMAKDPSGRPADAAAFADELRTIAAEAYGEDWEERGRSRLAEAAALLAALWPSGASPAAQGSAVEQVSLAGSSQADLPVSPAASLPVSPAASLPGSAAASLPGGGTQGSRESRHLRHVRHLEHLRHLRHLRALLAGAGAVAVGAVVTVVVVTSGPSGPSSGASATPAGTGISSSGATARPAAASTTTIPVVACQTGSGQLSTPSPRYRTTAAITVPPSVGTRLAYYTDSARSIQPIAGPRGWSCSVTIGGDGSTFISIFPPGQSSASQEQVDAASPTCVGCIYGTACPLVPHVAAEVHYILPPLPCSRPAREAVTWLAGSPAQTSSGYDAVGFVDPPGVKGDGQPSGGAYYARGVLLYAWGGPPRTGYGASLMTCALPASDGGLCTAILTVFRQQRWLLSASSSG